MLIFGLRSDGPGEVRGRPHLVPRLRRSRRRPKANKKSLRGLTKRAQELQKGRIQSSMHIWDPIFSPGIPLAIVDPKLWIYVWILVLLVLIQMLDPQTI